VYGWELSNAERAEMADRIAAEPQQWCAQEPLPMSTAPVVTEGGLEPRRLVLRTFAVAAGGSYRVMAGGLTRVAASGQTAVSNQAGSIGKDVWVLGSPRTVAAAGAWVDDGRPVAGVLSAAAMSPRVAEDLFWLGRYAERAEDAVRLLRVVDDLAGDFHRGPAGPGPQCLDVMLQALTRVTTTFPGFVGDDAERRREDPMGELLDLTVDVDRPGTLAHALARAMALASAVREQLSMDTWLVLGSLERVLHQVSARDGAPEPVVQPALARVLEGLLALAGLGAESMVRDPGWYFMDAGRRLERAMHLVALLRHTLVEERAAATDDLVTESVLVAAETIITYRRRYQSPARIDAVLDLLVLDRANPRAVAYQLDRVAEDLQLLPAEPSVTASLDTQVRDLTARLRESDPAVLATADAGLRITLRDFLDRLSEELRSLSAAVESAHFVHVAPPRPLSPAAGWDRW
jgi:uncharacterized alpha-E superfamily protein